MTDHLTLAEALAIHEDQLERFGGSAGVRDFGQLEATLFRPRTGYYPDVIAEAAALWESFSQHHAFVDANQRVGFAVTYTFLAINGVAITADADEVWAFVSELYETGQFRLERLDPWLRRHSKPVD